MKRYLIILFAIQLIIQANLHSQEYSKVVNEGSVWQILFSVDGVKKNFGYRIDSDTLVNGILYNKLIHLELSSYRINDDYFILNESFFGLIREDTLEKKVYLKKDSTNGFLFKEECEELSEKLVLDFSLDIGDTISTCVTYFEEEIPCVIDTIYETFEWGKLRKVRACTIYDEEKMTEGVGFTDGLWLFGEHIPQTANWGQDLYKYCDGSIEEDCSLFQSPTSITDVNKDFIEVYPNPVRDHLRIRVNSNKFDLIELFDHLGRLIKKIETESNKEMTITMEDFQSGMYFIRIRSERGNYLKRVIIKH